MRGNVVESGLLEIYRFLPPALLEDFDIEEIGLDEFLRYVAKARYIQELEESEKEMQTIITLMEEYKSHNL